MTGNIHTEPLRPLRSHFHTLSGAFCLCAILALSGCGMTIPFMGKGKNNEKITETTSHIAPAKAASDHVNNKNMFGGSLNDENERMARMERAVQKMRNDFDNVAPSIKRLMAIEGDMKTLIVALKKMTAEPNMAVNTPDPVPPPMAQDMNKKTKSTPTMEKIANSAAKSTLPPPPVQNGKASVYGVRIGEHPGKTRIVLDVNAKTNFKTDIDNGEKIMIVDLPEAGWDAAMTQNFRRSPFITSYTVEGTGDGTMLIFQLKKDAQISYKDDLPSISGTGRRIVIDLMMN